MSTMKRLQVLWCPLPTLQWMLIVSIFRAWSQSFPVFLKHRPSCCCPELQRSMRAMLMIWLFPGRFFLCDFHEFCPQIWSLCMLCALFPPGSAAQAHSLSLAQSKVLIQHQRLLQNNEFLLTAKCYRPLDVELIGKIKGRPRGETCDLFPKQKKALRWTLSGLSHSHSLGSVSWSGQICVITLQHQRNSAFDTGCRNEAIKQSHHRQNTCLSHRKLCQKLAVNGSSLEVPESSLHLQLHLVPQTAAPLGCLKDPPAGWGFLHSFRCLIPVLTSKFSKSPL